MRRVLLAATLAALVVAPSAGAWTWPASGPVLQHFVFDAAHPYAAGEHRGIDVAGAAGDTVPAPRAGTITFAGAVPSSGLTVTITTADGFAVSLSHLGSIGVDQGATVAEGDTVGTLGASGDTARQQPYVHLGVRVASEQQGYVDPEAYLPVRTAAEPPPAPVAGGPPAAPEAVPTGTVASPPAVQPASPDPVPAPPDAVAPALSVQAATEPSVPAVAADAATPDARIVVPANGVATADGAAAEPPSETVVAPPPEPVAATVVRAPRVAATPTVSKPHAAMAPPPASGAVRLAAPLSAVGLPSPAVTVARPARPVPRVAPFPRAQPVSPPAPAQDARPAQRDRGATSSPSVPAVRRVMPLVLGAALLLAALGGALLAAALARVRTRAARIIDADVEQRTEDPGRAGVAVCGGTPPPWPYRGLRGAGGRLRALPPLAWERRADGQRHRRARHTDHGRRGSRREVLR